MSVATVTRPVTVATDIHGIFFTNITNILKSILCSTEGKLVQVWNNMKGSKWQNVHFWLNYPFK